MKQPWSIAHRGLSARCIENTIASHRAAIEAGADFVETDARLSADGDVFCIHDAELRRIAGIDLPVAEMPTRHLLAVKLPQGEHLTALPAVLGAVQNDAAILIDLKTPDIALLEAVLADVTRHSSNTNIWLGLRALPQLRRLRETSKLRCVALLGDYDEAESWIAAGADALRIWEGEFTDDLETRLAPLAPIWITAGGRSTPDQPGDIPLSRLQPLVRRRVQAILLNDPTMVAEALHKAAS